MSVNGLFRGLWVREGWVSWLCATVAGNLANEVCNLKDSRLGMSADHIAM